MFEPFDFLGISKLQVDHEKENPGLKLQCVVQVVPGLCPTQKEQMDPQTLHGAAIFAQVGWLTSGVIDVCIYSGLHSPSKWFQP